MHRILRWALLSQVAVRSSWLAALLNQVAALLGLGYLASWVVLLSRFAVILCRFAVLSSQAAKLSSWVAAHLELGDLASWVVLLSQVVVLSSQVAAL